MIWMKLSFLMLILQVKWGSSSLPSWMFGWIYRPYIWNLFCLVFCWIMKVGGWNWGHIVVASNEFGGWYTDSLSEGYKFYSIASIGPLALSVHTRTAKTLQTLHFNFVQQLRKPIIDSCDSRLSQAASSNIGQHISCQAAGMITLGNLMSSCSERQSGWTVSKRCTVTFLILNAFEYHLVPRDVTITTQKKRKAASPWLPSLFQPHVMLWHINICIWLYMQYMGATSCVVSSLTFQTLRAELIQENGTMVPLRGCKACAPTAQWNLEVLKQGYTFTPVIHQGIKRNQTSNCV